MTHVSVCLTIAALSIASLPGQVKPRTAPVIAVFVDFEKQPSAFSVAQMKQEVEAIMRPAGLQFEWRQLNDPRGQESFADLVVMRFKGACQMEGTPMYSELGPESGAGELANTKVSGGRVLPFSEIECDRIRRYIAPEARDQAGDLALGRAMGRVVAHELYHMFTGSKKHASDGVARSFQTRKELVGNEFALDPKAAAAVREWKWRALLAGEARIPDLGPQ
jgi:hypothetical protein